MSRELTVGIAGLGAIGLHLARALDARLVEIGMGAWGGRYYAEVIGEVGAVVTPDGLLRPAPDGEDYRQIATRVSGWLADTDAPDDRLVIMHGISSRVLRGVMRGLPVDPALGVPLAPGLPQGSVALIEGGRETVAHLGGGHAPV